MNTAVRTTKKQTIFRLDNNLVERLKAQAQKERRSLNNYVECLLYDAVYDVPNAETIAAIKEARSNKNLETLDLEHFEEQI